ncbi:TonB-dependent siderophore receptor [Burkholderia sp. 22PA0099]|uniref:TonB-dependent siderophore receptor n=1 Tax=Burkholderia sp. 22PA0099 TaxID=3237372 RepID=UPI0039C130FA
MHPTRTARPPRPFSLVPSRGAAVRLAFAPSRVAGRLAAVVLLSALVPPAAMAAGATANAADAADAPAVASAGERSYDIPAGPLEGALNRFGHEAGILLAFPASQVAGLQSAGLHGRYAVPQALGQLLSGSGLAAQRQPGGGYTLVHGAQSGAAAAGNDSAIALAPVQVRDRGVKADSYRPQKEAGVTRSEASLLDTAQAVNIVSAQVLRDQKPRNLDDALGNISGITQGNTLAGTQDAIMKRGFGDNRDGSIMRNGMPVVQGRALNATADSVEVLKGPTSLLYGIMDPGGVINVVGKVPQLTRSNTVSATGETYGHGKNGGEMMLDLTGPIGDTRLAYRLIVDHSDEQYWRNFGTSRETLVAPSLGWYGRDTQVVVSYEHRDFLYPFDRGTALDPRTNAPLAIPARERLDEPWNNMVGASNLFQIQADHQFNADWNVHVGYSYNRETYDANQVRITAVNTAKGTLSRSDDATHGADSTDSYGIAYVNGKVRLAGMRHDLQFGMDSEYRSIYRADLLRQAVSIPFSYLNPVYDLIPPSSTISAPDSDQTDRLHSLGLFAQDTVHLTDKWIVTAGVRFMRYSELAGKGRPFVANTDLNGTKWLPRVGVVYKAANWFSLYGNYSQSLKPTSSIAALSSGFTISGATPPEQATAYEVGAKLDMPSGMTGTLALFDIEKKNVLVSQFNDVTNLTDWRTSGRARSRGIELDVSGKIGDNWNVIASYAYIDAKTTEDPVFTGNRLWNVARNTGSIAAVYDVGALFGGDDLRLGGSARYIGSRPGDSANSFTLPSYVLADAFATYETKIGKQNLSVQLNVKNLFNRTYYPSSANRFFVAIGDARQVLLTTTLQF